MSSLFGPTKNGMPNLIEPSEEENRHADAQYRSNKGYKAYDVFGQGGESKPIPKGHTLRGNDDLFDLSTPLR